MSKSKVEECKECYQPLNDQHSEASCLRTQANQWKERCNKLNQSINSWKNAWYEQREIIGHLHWHHPAIESLSTREQIKSYLREPQLQQWRKTIVDAIFPRPNDQVMKDLQD